MKRAGLALSTVLFAANAFATPVRPIRFDRLSLEEGLSQSTVQDVLQDSQGYIWLATEDGLNRYDGLSFKVYRRDPMDAASLPGSFIWDIEEDTRGNVWVATAAGLARWDRSTDRFEALFGTPHGTDVSAAAALGGARFTRVEAPADLAAALEGVGSPGLRIIEARVVDRATNVEVHHALGAAVARALEEGGP